MTSRELGDILGSKARLKISDLISVRPRTLKELAEITGITVQAVLKHLEKLKDLGVLEEKRISSTELAARKVYSMVGSHIGDFSHGDLTIVKMSKSNAPSGLPKGGSLDQLEQLSEGFLVQRRRIREETRRLGRMIDELVTDEERLGALIGALHLRDDEKLILHTYFTEESVKEAEDSLEEHYGMENARRAIDQVLDKVSGLGKKTSNGN